MTKQIRGVERWNNQTCAESNTEVHKQNQLPEQLFGGDQVKGTALQPVPEPDHFGMNPGWQNHDEGGRPHKQVNTDRPGSGPETQQAKWMNKGQVSGAHQ